METQTLEVEVRELSGKGPARQLRAQGKIPGVFYGPGVDTTKLSLSPKELVKGLSTPYRLNAVFEVSVGGATHRVMVKDVAVHPVSRQPLHVDLYLVDDTRRVDVRVPVTTHGRPVGVVRGGTLHTVFRDLPIRCVPSKIPSIIDIDVSDLDIGDAVAVADLGLDEGIEVQFKPDRRVVLCTESRAEEVEEEEGEGEAVATEAPES